MQPSVRVNHLSKRFGNFFAVNDVSFSIHKGQVLGFLGPNGAGKSTTMRILTGYLPPSEGSVYVDGQAMADFPLQLKQKIGYLPEGGPLYQDMTVKNFLTFIAKIRGLYKAKYQERFAYVVENLHLSSVLNQNIDTLSKGFKRRVALAQAIIHDPKILVLDEPTDGLDPNQKHEVRTLIASMAKDKAIIVSTHILEEVEAVCSHALIIAKGKVVFSGTPEDITLQSPEYNALVITIAHPGEKKLLEKALSDHKDIAKWYEDSHGRLVVIPKKGKWLFETIQNMLHHHNIRVTSLFVKPGQMESAFRHITQK